MNLKENISEIIDWKTEMNRIASKHHIIVCWIAIVLNPIWFIGDYFTVPDYWVLFLKVRLLVTSLILIALVFRKHISTEILMTFPFLGISLQNAFMWSFMNISQLQQHAFAYIALFIGAGMLVLWKPLWSIGVVITSLVANFFFLSTFSQLTSQEILINGGLLVATVAILSVVLIHSRYTLTKKEIIARLALAASNAELVKKNDIIEEKNKDITDSINYAKRIQEAILPSIELKNKLFPDAFVMFLPRDIVSGDFYWFTEKNGKKLIAAVDCTGHGVPGAFMSMIGNAFLHQVVNEKGITTPSEILNGLRELIISALKQTGADGENKDGMDISLLCFDEKNNKVEYAGANNPLWIIRKSEPTTIEIIKGNKQPIGIYAGDITPFTNNVINVNKGDCLYIFTDGFADQMGGNQGKKFKQKNLRELIISLNDLPMFEQEKSIRDALKKWKGDFNQTDDILLIGARI